MSDLIGGDEWRMVARGSTTCGLTVWREWVFKRPYPASVLPRLVERTKAELVRLAHERGAVIDWSTVEWWGVNRDRA